MTQLLPRHHFDKKNQCNWPINHSLMPIDTTLQQGFEPHIIVKKNKRLFEHKF